MDSPTRDPGLARRVLRALRAKDPALAATRRAARGAIVMPALFALCSQVIGSPAMASFAAFGAFSMLLLVDFNGPAVQRLRAHAALAVAWAALICLGTAVSQVTWLGVATMVVVGFAILFSGIVSSVLAGATTALLLGFILPVSLSAPLSALPDRLAGAGMAAGASMLAVTLLWPRPTTDPLDKPAADVCRAVAVRLRVDAALVLGPDTPTDADCTAASRSAADAADRLRRAFDSTPYRPTGLSTGARAVVRLVDQLTWLTAIVAHSGTPQATARSHADAPCLAKRAAARTLDEAADLLEGRHTDPGPLQAAAEELRKALDAMERDATTRLPVQRDTPGDQEVTDFLSSLDVSFRTQELSHAVLQIAANVELASAAERRGWADRLLGREPGGLTGPLTAARERATAHVDRHSVWLHNSVRGAVGLGLAVAITDVTTVQHSFWVVLGALSVLRSNALNTGQNAVRGLAGTVIGSIVGAGLLQLIGHNSVLLWFLLPLAVLVAGIAPAAISFAAGQAAFTVTLVILFNIGQVPDWRVGLFRVEDIALGCAVSIVVGTFFWPRGAAAAVGKAMAEAYAASADYLAGAVDYGVGCCTAGPEPAAAPLAAGRQAAAAARRLDDAFRSYLAERGPKPVPLAEMTTLVTGVVGLRLAADAVLGMWQRAGDVHSDAERAAARSELLSGADRISGWYHGLAAGLDGSGRVPVPLPHDGAGDARLVVAVRRDLRDEDGRATATAVRIVWTGDHLDAARRLQTSLAHAATSLP
ncbi:FUSC family protein [Actinacidiphila bryophytorum]|uniref:Fusaric acid resistance protein-like n=1 Tax=Actinacidiphila bryophytorum TaxID=1436133 RepID=A0A9W4ED21_9ACTN|nr:FUSC family protein [Actinacidiphila bryophytorum]MBM9439219.1 FUSC family protein [Actinacidiphila bryophytorum]MBN6545876.1 FUSC family protein [Actinacidiphila bryophytorum]CAG7620571.1 Fusaric acid resistance protein-like [Actinacidiphila bryophytorum]